jgi:hypothetical protein
MWTPSKFSTYKKQFDFTSSGQAKSTYTSLTADDEILINMIELFEEDDNSTFQFLICEDCGVTQCAPGNWLSVRQSGNYALFIPAFKKILEQTETNEFKPPYFFNTKGALILTIDHYNNLKDIVPAFPDFTKLKCLSGFEALSLYKWETPHKMFGDFPNFKPLKTDHILWTSELDEPSVSKIIIDKTKSIAVANTVHFVPLKDSEVPVSVFLEDFTTTEWKALCKTPHGFELLMGNTYKLNV